MQTSFTLSCQCKVTITVDEDTGEHKYMFNFHKRCGNSLDQEYKEVEENTGMKVNSNGNTLVDRTE